MKFHQDCGCVIIVDRRLGDDVDDAYIKYCPKHAAAPALYEALKELYSVFCDDYENGLANGYWPDLRPLDELVKDALALVDGESDA